MLHQEVIQFILQISAKVFLTAQLYHHPSPPPPFQTLHQLSIAVKCELTLFTLLAGSIWSGLLLISNLISYHNIPNPASAFHHIGLLTIHKHVGFYPASTSLCMQFPSGLKCPFSFHQPTPHTVQLTLEHTGLNCMSPLSSRLFQQQILQYYTFLVC